MFRLRSLGFVFALFAAVNADYCHVRECSNPERHVMCLYSKNSQGADCGPVTRIWVRPEERNEILNTHKAIRASSPKKELLPLEWDIELENIAQRWANQCPKTNDECRSSDDYQSVVQQNVGLIVQPITDDINEKKPNFSAQIQKWSMMPHNPINPWSDTYKGYDRIGCGLTETRNLPAVAVADVWRGAYKYYLVCNYAIAKRQ